VVLLSDFYDRVLEGNLAKELVKALLEKSGYLVIPYGYESTLSNLRKRLARRGTKKSRAVRKIRSSPDLLVYDGQRKDLMLVEIKMRKAPTETRVWLYKQRVAEYTVVTYSTHRKSANCEQKKNMMPQQNSRNLKRSSRELRRKTSRTSEPRHYR
jgi:hypothetical protein